jgi:acetyltransferase-like isoleucine patch superfamily enzyme
VNIGDNSVVTKEVSENTVVRGKPIIVIKILENKI